MHLNMQVERDRKRFVKQCLRHRQQAYTSLKFAQTQARYDGDPDLRERINELKEFIAQIDFNLAQAGHVLH